MEPRNEDSLYRLAIEQIRKSGVKFTVEDLCREAKISKKTFYFLYPSKGSFAKNAYAYAFSHFDEAEKEYMENPKPGEEAYELFSSYSDLLMVTSDRTFNLYSLEQLLREKALEEMEKRRKALKKDLLSSFSSDYQKHPSIFLSIESTLAALGKENRRKALLQDYMEVMKPLWK